MSELHDREFAIKPPSLALSDAVEPRAWYESLLERDLIPDGILRAGIRRLLRQRLRDESRGGAAASAARKLAFIESLKTSPIAVRTDAANRQHYEVPTEFFRYALGRRMKYSCALWLPHTNSLDEAEEAMLALTCERAHIENGQRILELGCGWGSLSLYMAERFPKSEITAVSNSRTQREFLESEIAKRGLRNLTIVTADMNDFQPAQRLDGLDRFDRIVSVEMFEHMRNYETLFARIASWLCDDGLLFVHVFAHRTFAYPYDVRDESDWMAQHFFSGGLMPSEDLFQHFEKHMRTIAQWRVNGTHYQKTAEAWLRNMDAHKDQILPLFAQTYGTENARRWWVRWRIFFMACAELWGYRNGGEWIVSHSLFGRSDSQVHITAPRVASPGSHATPSRP